MGARVPSPKPGDWESVRQAIRKLAGLKLDIIQSDLQVSIDSVETIASDAASLASDNVTRIDSVETIVSDNTVRIDSVETIASDNAIAIASVETIASDALADASDNLIRIDSIETLASDNTVRIDSIETVASDAAAAASDNLLRIDSIEILASDNAVAIASVETIASDALADASDNLIRIDSIETLASDNRVSIDSIETIASDNRVSIDSIETIASDNTVRIDSVETVASDATVLASDHIANDGTDHSFIDQDVTTSASPTFADLTLSDMQLGSPTYPSVHDFLSTTVSVGQTSGGAVTDNGDGTVTVAAGTGYIKKTDSSIGKLVTFDWAEDDSVSLTDNSTNYILIKYNGGSPIVDSTDDFNSINFHTEFVVGLVYREGTDVKILQAGNRLPDAQIRFCVQKYLRGIEHISGGSIAEKATRYVTSTAGIFYIGDTRIDTGAFDSSVEDFEHYYYRDGAGGWNEATSTGQIDNVYYDDGSGTLAELTANRYGVHWVYISFEGKLSIIYGQDNYKYNEAVLATPPSSIPDFLEKFAILAGKIVIQKNASSFSEVESAFVTFFVPETTFDHNDLSSLQGGMGGEYYHLTSAQYTDLTDSGNCTIHYHSSDRDRSNHTGTQLASTISDFNAAAQDAVGNILADTSSIDFTYNDAIPQITASVIPGGVDHDSLANVHQDVTTSASPTFEGLALTGGTISSSTITLNTFTAINLNTPDISLTIDNNNNQIVTTVTAFGISTITPRYIDEGSELALMSVTTATSNMDLGIKSQDPDNATKVGALNFLATGQDTGHERIASISAATDGSTVGQRGGKITFYTKSDGSTSLSERLSITEDGDLIPTGNIIMPDGGVIGNSSGPQITFNDTSNLVQVSNGTLEVVNNNLTVKRTDTENTYVYINAPSGKAPVFEFMENGVRKWTIWNDPSAGTDRFTWNDPSGTLMVLMPSTGRLGIGTVNPNSKLHVKDGNIHLQRSSGNVYMYINAGSGSAPVIELQDGSTRRWTIWNDPGGGNHYLKFNDGSGTRFTVSQTSGNVGIGTSTFGASATKTLTLKNGTAPTSSPADSVQLYSADYAAGHACLHIRNEDGDIIKLEQQNKANYNNWATLADVVDALVAIGLFDAA